MQNVYLKRLKEDFPHLHIVKNNDSNEGNTVLVYDSRTKIKTFKIRLIDINKSLFNEKIYKRLKKDVIQMCNHLNIKGEGSI